MFKGLFKKHVQNDDIFEVDPVVEQRRKEKFSTPLIYDEEFKNEETEKPKETVKVKPVEKPKVSESKKVIENEPEEIYRMSEIISPMRGVTKSKEPEKKVSKKNKVRPKRKLSDDELVPVLSPYFGNFEKKVEVETESKLTAIKEEKADIKEEKVVVKEEKPKVEKKVSGETNGLPTVEDNLRNIAKIVEEEKDQLKIIEERTGEFKLDFSKNEEKKKDSLIDEIDDDMSLDELMSLYEKKFKD